MKETQAKLECGVCGANNCRIYRPYAEFRRQQRDKCNKCVPDAERGWYVPTVVSDDGLVWGFSAVPEVDCEKFYVLPEASEHAPSWQKVGGWS